MSALCLVASDGVAIFHLKGIEKSIFLQRTVAGTLVARQFLLHLHEKLLILLACESRSIGGERIEHHTGIKLHLMVGEIEGYAGKAEAVSLLGAAHARYPCHIAIGYEIYFVVILTPIVVVLRHKQQVAAHKLIFAIKHLVAHTQIEKSGTAVASGDDNGFAYSVAVVTIADGFEQELARQHLDVAESREAQSRCLQSGNLARPQGCNGIAQTGGIAQHPRVAALPHHIGEREAIHTKPVGTEHA